MHARSTSPPSLRRLALLQDGVVTRQQAVGCGLSPRVLERLVQEGLWRRLTRGVFLTADLDPPWRALAWAGVLIGGERARLGGTSAGHLHGLVATAPLPVTVLIPHDARIEAGRPWVLRREREGSFDPVRRGNPPRLGVEDTILDLAGTGRPNEVVGWVTAAVQRRLTNPHRLLLALDRRQRQRHRALIRGLLTDVAEGAESYLEVLYLRDVERAHGLPRARRQVRADGGRFVRDVDYGAYGVIVELDGRMGHVELGRFRDMWRDNVAILEGRMTLRYGALDLTHRACEIADQVARVLSHAGWPGLATRCPRCRRVA